MISSVADALSWSGGRKRKITPLRRLANALPAGLSLDRVPGIGKAAESSGAAMNTVATILILAALAVAGWYLVQKSGLLQPKPTQTTTSTAKQ